MPKRSLTDVLQSRGDASKAGIRSDPAAQAEGAQSAAEATPSPNTPASAQTRQERHVSARQTPSSRRRPLWRFLGRRALSPYTRKTAELCYRELVGSLKGKPPRQVVVNLWRALAGLYARLDEPGADHQLPIANHERIAWETRCLLIDRINEQIAQAWHRGGAWRAAIEKGVPDDLIGADRHDLDGGGLLRAAPARERGAQGTR